MEAAVAAAEYVKSGRPIYGEPGDCSSSKVRSAPLDFDGRRLAVLCTGVVGEHKCNVTSRSGLIECFHILGKERSLLISHMALVLLLCPRTEKKDKKNVHP